MKRKGPIKFFYPLLKLSEAEVNVMARAWFKSIRGPQTRLSPVEEALLYGARTNPMQCFRVVRKICRKTQDEKILKSVGVDLLEELAAYSALKIKRNLLNECKVNKSFKTALSHVYLSRRDKGFFLVLGIVKSFHYF